MLPFLSYLRRRMLKTDRIPSYCTEQKPRAKPCCPRHAAGMVTPLERWLWSSRGRRQHTSKALHIDCSSTREYTWYVLSPVLLARSESETWFLQQTIAACCARKRTPLAEPAWMMIPWSKSSKTHKDKLVDIFVEIPSLLEDLDHLKQSPTEQLYRQFMTDYARIDLGLTAWLQNHAPVQHLDILQARGHINPTAEDLAVAQIMSLFWTMSILAHNAMLLAVTLDPSSSPLSHLPPHTNPRQYCTFIADIVEVFFQPEAGIFGMQAVPFPVGIALEYLMSTEGYGSDVSKKLAGYLTNRGFGISIGNFIMSSRKEWMGPRMASP
jgi:hypothetical protein